MNRLKRTVLICTTIVVLVLIALTAVLYLPTRAALERAEAFQFRRLVVTRLEEQNAHRFFFATNRRLEDGNGNGNGDLDVRFSSQREARVQFGAFDTVIEPALGVGMLINPTEWLQNEEINLQELRTLRENEFVPALAAMVENSPRHSLLIVVHGFREAFPSALRKTAFLSHVLDIDSPVLLFDWPGNQGSTPIGYRRARAIARDSGEELAATLEIVIDRVRPQRLWLVANSMGAEVVVNAFGLLYERRGAGDSRKPFETVVLTAPDVSHQEFDDRFREEITALSRNLTVYLSSNDRALVMSRILNRERRLGEGTLGQLSPDQMAEAAALAELAVPESEGIMLVDVTPINRTRNFHNFSLETPEFFDDLYLRLTNARMPSTRQRYPLQAPNGSVYWVLTSNR